MPPARRLTLPLPALCLLLLASTGCATIRVTDPPRSADEQFLLSTAANRAVAQLSVEALRDRKVFVDAQYFNAPEQSYVVGELRAKLLLGGVRMVDDRKSAQIVLEVRAPGIGVNRTEFLLGLSSIPVAALFGNSGNALANTTTATPELALLKNTKQQGFAAVAYVAYWADTGEIVTSSGPFVGRTIRDDWWILGAGPKTVGNIPPTDK